MKSSKLNEAAALAEKAAEATAAAQLAQNAALEAKAEFDAEAEGRRQKFMTQWLAEEFVQAPEADIALLASKAAFEEAVRADPLMQVWLAHLRSHLRISADGQTAQNFASQVGVTAPVYDMKGSFPTFFEVMQRAMEQLAQRLEGERQAEIFEALEAAANGDDDVLDAFDPREDGTYPWFPRLANGTPAWSDTPSSDGIPVAGLDGLTTPMPRGLRVHDGRLVDLTPTGADGSPINPPTRLP